MQMNNQTKLTFALEHIAHLEDYIEKKSSLFDSLSTIKIELEKQLKLEQNRKTKMSQTQEDLIVNVGDRVFFNYDSFELDSDAQELLQDQVAWLKQYSDVSVIIEGHCDERGTREYNLALGEKRAQSVKNYLISLGISSDRVTTISYGKERPAVVGSNDGAWAQNRRSVTLVN